MPIPAWLLRCWDNGAGRQKLEGHEAQQLGSLAKDREIERGIGKERAICSLWRRLLSSVRARYPFKEDLVTSPGKWTTADEGIQYLRELAVLEIIYGDLRSGRVLEDPEDAPCTMAMWRKVVQSAPASYSSSLVSLLTVGTCWKFSISWSQRQPSGATQVMHECETCCNQGSHTSGVSLEERAVAGVPVWGDLANGLYWAIATNTPRQELHPHHGRDNNWLAGNIPCKTLSLLERP
uniref:Uncharacterized protein n=1 Tax=Catharus ustulatus TaxID=91951 RepID=A0A8C3VGY1_CATUS